MKALVQSWKKWLAIGLEEDSIGFDWTARAAALSRGKKANASIRATLIAKANGIWAAETGLEALEILSQEMGLAIRVRSLVKNGDTVKPKLKICEWTGSSEAIVTFERTFINLAAYTSGIATQTRAFVERVNAKKMKNPPRITGTRKTLPGYRELAIESTLIGGAHPHRFNLSGGVLIKENHIAAAGSVEAAVKHAREVAPHLLKIEIEVKNEKELKEAIKADAEVIMLDNFSPAQIKSAISLKPASGFTFEASGGISLDTIDQYLIEGLDVISIGSITHSVKALDLSLLVTD